MNQICFVVLVSLNLSFLSSTNSTGQDTSFYGAMRLFFSTVDRGAPSAALGMIDGIIRVYGKHPKFDFFKAHVLSMLGRDREAALFFQKCINNTNRSGRRVCPHDFVIQSRLSLRHVVRILRLQKKNELLSIEKQSVNRFRDKQLIRFLRRKIQKLQHKIKKMRFKRHTSLRKYHDSSQIQRISFELQAAPFMHPREKRNAIPRTICSTLYECIQLCQRGDGRSCCNASRIVSKRFRRGPYARNRCNIASMYYRRAIHHGYIGCDQPCQTKEY